MARSRNGDGIGGRAVKSFLLGSAALAAIGMTLVAQAADIIGKRTIGHRQHGMVGQATTRGTIHLAVRERQVPGVRYGRGIPKERRTATVGDRQAGDRDIGT